MEETIKYYHACISCELAGTLHSVGCLVVQLEGTPESLSPLACAAEIASGMIVEMREISMEEFCLGQIQSEDGRNAN